MHTLTPGEWYLCYSCKSCHSRQVLFPDLSNGQTTLNVSYEVTCENCKHRASYEPEELERYQHPEDAEPEIR
jgi:hypothetical protein